MPTTGKSLERKKRFTRSLLPGSFGIKSAPPSRQNVWNNLRNTGPREHRLKERIDETADNPGRDHHPNAYSMWIAGGGTKGGQVAQPNQPSARLTSPLLIRLGGLVNTQSAGAGAEKVTPPLLTFLEICRLRTR